MSAPTDPTGTVAPTGLAVPAAAAPTGPPLPLAAQPTASVDVSDRMDRLWDGLFLVMLALPTVLALLDAETSATERGVVLGLAVALAAWHLTVFPHVPRDVDVPGWTAWGHWLVVGAAVTVLAGIDGVFTFVLYGLYPLLFISLGWWGVPAIAGITALLSWQVGAFANGSAGLINVLASSAVALAVAVFIDGIARQSAQRRDALEALAATRTELAEVARRAGALGERERLAREIHDTVAQALASVVTQLEAADQALPPDADVSGRHLSLARQAARDGLTEVRRSVQALRPELLDGSGLTAALRRLCERWSTETGVVARLQVDQDEVALHPEAEVALLRAAQEALANVARHARATSVTVVLSQDDDVAHLRISDDGVGVPLPVPGGPAGPVGADADHSTGFGLQAMGQRISAIGGRVTISSTTGQGTTIAVEVPT